MSENVTMKERREQADEIFDTDEEDSVDDCVPVVIQVSDSLFDASAEDLSDIEDVWKDVCTSVNQTLKRNKIKTESEEYNLESSACKREDEIQSLNERKEEAEEKSDTSKSISHTQAICGICNRKFTSISRLRQHKKKHNKTSQRPNRKPYTCDICHKVLKCKQNMKVHMMVHSSRRPFKCKVCGNTYKTKTTLVRHSARHSVPLVKHKCEFCSKELSSLATLRSHVQLHFEEMKYPCTECDRSFLTVHRLRYHSQIHGQKSFICHFCDKGFVLKTHLKSHIHEHHLQLKEFTCSRCKFSFSRRESLRKHLEIHNCEEQPAVYTCSKFPCSERFTKVNRYMTHMEQHEKMNILFKCPECWKVLSSASAYNAHMEEHATHVCGVCGLLFLTELDLINHERVHFPSHSIFGNGLQC